MNLLENIKALCKENNISQRKLEKDLDLSNGSSSKWAKSSPSTDVLQKIADYFNVSIDYLTGKSKYRNFAEEFDAKYDTKQLKEECSLYETGEFKTAEAAMQFILSQPSIMAYGGFDIKKLSDQDKIDFANDLLSQLKLLGLKYNK